MRRYGSLTIGISLATVDLPFAPEISKDIFFIVRVQKQAGTKRKIEKIEARK
ncbi:MAG: hypothetical protein HGB00_08285 [Chlorobiaceae bacterium]|nr:hypothetical protein [Chlorobiaceae bacterium]